MSLKKALGVLVIVGVIAIVVAFAGGFSYPAVGITLCGAIVLAGHGLGEIQVGNTGTGVARPGPSLRSTGE